MTEEQVQEMDLPTRPPKRKGDTPAVELDAIPASDLRRIAADCIEEHIDRGILERIRREEEAERETLGELVDGFAA